MGYDDKFAYKEIDQEGLETLDAISAADKFNHWMYKTIKPHCSGKILEIGSGIGNISKHFLHEGAQIYVSDIRDNYCDILRKSFKHHKNLKGVLKLDIASKDFDKDAKNLIGKFDTVFALNVIEHIKDDQKALQNCNKLLKKGGKIVILVPAYQKLYNQFDEELQHFRRYTHKIINNVLKNAGFDVKKHFYFNFMGIFGWFVSGKLQKNKTIPKGQMSLYNLLVPIFKIIDKILFNKAGLSVVSIGEKK